MKSYIPVVRWLALLVGSLTVGWLLLSCVDPFDRTLRGTVNVVVVDGMITNLAEPQIIRLNRSRADSLTGRFGTLPITKAIVEVVVDSGQVVACHETVDGSYQLPSDFKGQVGHAYQLRFTLSDGTRYLSSQQVIAAVPPISQISAQFNPTSLSPPLLQLYAAGHDVFIDTQDPVDEHNYYRWEWKLWEKQNWCRTCVNGVYAVNNVTIPYNGYYVSGDQPYEDCFKPPYSPATQALPDFTFDYPCRTQCWEILFSRDINVFDDLYTNGGLIANQSVGHIPFYQESPCLVEIRQLSLSKDAYRYFKLFQNQTQNTGGLADTPPTALAGNVHNQANRQEIVVGYFTASAVATKRIFLDRTDTQGRPPGLFYGLNDRIPIPETISSFIGINIVGGPVRPPTAVCGPIDQRTPIKPEGWRD
ncbi:DUF4249 domain-containing protein [Spirosoma arcticum]